MKNHIASTGNARIKGLVRLLEKSAERKERAQWLVTGLREVERAWDAGAQVIALYLYEEYLGDLLCESWTQKAQRRGVECIYLTKKVFDKLSAREHPDGLVAQIRAPSQQLSALTLSSNPLIVMVEGVEKPGNLGALIRTVEATGADALVVCDPAVDLGNPSVIRASQGLVFTLPIALTDRESLFAWIKEKNLRTVATTPDPSAQCYWESDLRGPIMILTGTESTGLSDFWLTNADARVRIPMKGTGDSLNLGIATALVAYEVLRQRG